MLGQIQKEYFLRLFQSVFFILPIMQFNFLLKLLSWDLLAMKHTGRHVNCLDGIMFNRAMENMI